jgi:hypothetical protein
MVAFAASAAPERTSIGPNNAYNVSFDLNTTLNQSLQEQPAVVTPLYSAYPLLITTDKSSLAEIVVVEYKNLTDSTPNSAIETLRLRMEKQGYYKNITVAYAPIGPIDDGTKGLVVSGLNESDAGAIWAWYWLDSESCNCGPVSVGRINVQMRSFFPLEVTASLLNTIHVEKKLQTPAAP